MAIVAMGCRWHVKPNPHFVLRQPLVRFPYDPQIVEFMRTIRTAHFDRENTQWKFSADMYDQVTLRAASVPHCTQHSLPPHPVPRGTLNVFSHMCGMRYAQVVSGLLKSGHQVEEPPEEELKELNLKRHGVCMCTRLLVHS